MNSDAGLVGFVEEGVKISRQPSQSKRGGGTPVAPLKGLAVGGRLFQLLLDRLKNQGRFRRHPANDFVLLG